MLTGLNATEVEPVFYGTGDCKNTKIPYQTYHTYKYNCNGSEDHLS